MSGNLRPPVFTCVVRPPCASLQTLVALQQGELLPLAPPLAWPASSWLHPARGSGPALLQVRTSESPRVFPRRRGFSSTPVTATGIRHGISGIQPMIRLRGVMVARRIPNPKVVGSIPTGVMLPIYYCIFCHAGRAENTPGAFLATWGGRGTLQGQVDCPPGPSDILRDRHLRIAMLGGRRTHQVHF